MSKKDKKQSRNFLNQNPLESLGGILQGTGTTLAKDLAGAGASDLFGQLLGIETPKEAKSGELREGEELNLKKAKEQAVEPGIDYRREIVHSERITSRENERAIQVRIEEIYIEIKKLVSSSQELESQFKDVAVETPIIKPGKYHENFFEWIFSTIKKARMRIEESAGWLSAMHSKKDRKYWAQFKKHGTTFGLSNERVVATQVG